MRTAKNILILALFIAGGATGAYLLAQHNAPPAPLSKRATDAYLAGNYAEAAPLLRQWAKTMTVKADGPALGKVLTELADAEAHLKGTVNIAVSTQSVTPIANPDLATFSPPTPAPATGPIDPSTGKPRIPHPLPAPGQMQIMTIKELGNFDFDPTANTPIPDDVKALNGTKIQLRGFMIPLTQAETITNFALVPSLVGCCFGQPPGVQHTITCKTLPGRAVPYTVDEISVQGTLRINIQTDQGYTFDIFDMDVTSVKPVE